MASTNLQPVICYGYAACGNPGSAFIDQLPQIWFFEQANFSHVVFANNGVQFSWDGTTYTNLMSQHITGLSNGTLELPNVGGADTLAALAFSQTFSGTDTFSGTINFTGTVQGNSITGVTCSGTPTSSFASTKGIVTHC